MSVAEKRGVALAGLAEGLSAREVARGLGISPGMVWRWAKLEGVKLQHGRLGGVPELRPRAAREPRRVPEGDWVDGNGRLTQAGRMVIAIRLSEGRGDTWIAAELGVARSTVWRERQRGSVEGKYRWRPAQTRADQARKRPKPGKLAPGSAVRAEVVERLKRRDSPEQISGRLKLDFPDREDMWVSHETIYQALYIQTAGSLRHELTVDKALRQGRSKRRPRSKLPAKPRGWIGEDAVLAKRPEEADDKRVPGHWEGDLIIGSDLRSALVTLDERHTKYTMMRRVCVHDTFTVTDILTIMARELPASLWRSLTWDQGVEMAAHHRFTDETSCKVYFCDPHSPWQRPTNENSNGLKRQYFPKGTDFTRVTDAEVAAAEYELNTRPRKGLDYETPAEKLAKLVGVAPTD